MVRDRFVFDHMNRYMDNVLDQDKCPGHCNRILIAKEAMKKEENAVA